MARFQIGCETKSDERCSYDYYYYWDLGIGDGVQIRKG